MHRIKFRIHGGLHPGKFAYNVPEDANLQLSPQFRPVGPNEMAAYSLRAGPNYTLITIHGVAAWNGKIVPSGVYDVRAGHILTASGITVEILECPERAAIPGRETTQFLDIRSLSAEAPVVPVATETAPVAPVALVAPMELPIEDEPQDKIVGSIFFDVAPPPAIPRPKLRSFSKVKGSEADPMRSRRASLLRGTYVAGGFLVFIIAANQVAQRYTFDIEVPEPVVNTGYIPRHAHREQPAVVAVAPIPLIEPLPVLPAVEAERSPASLPFAPDHGAKLASLGKDLMSAVEEGNLKLVTKLVEEDGVSPDFTIDDLGRSPFVRAAAAGRVSVMQYLISKRVALSAIDYNGNNALMWSAINGHEKTAAYLLTLGLSPYAKREDGKTALQLARLYRQKTIESLLNRAPASVPSPNHK